MDQNNGGIIGKINTPTTSVASGVWSLQDQFESQSSSIWPLAFPQITIANALRFENTSTDGLTRTITSSGNRRTWTWSGWVKRSKLTNTTGDPQILFNSGQNTSGILDFNVFRFNTDDTFLISGVSNNGATTNYSITTNAVYRDVSAWYHVVVAFDSTQETSSDRIKLYINGVQVTSFSSTTYPSLNYDSFVNFVTRPYYGIGDRINTSGQLFAGYMTEVVLIDGQQLLPTSFGAFNPVTNIWEPIGYAGTYGTNGFRLDFADSSALGNDVSGNNNDFTVNNLTSIDQSTDTCSNNFCAFNPIDIPTNSSGSTGTIHDLSDGNLTLTNTNSAFREARSTFYLTQGKWYWEAKSTREGGSQSQVGVVLNNYSGGSGQRRVYQHNAKKYDDGGSSDYGATWTTNDIIGVALNLDDGEITFYKNGSSQGVAFTDLLTGIDDTGWTPTFNSYNGDMSFNFGSPPYTISSGNADANGFGNFEYAVPSGYFALNTKNLSEFG
jgi:hypothetical protein